MISQNSCPGQKSNTFENYQHPKANTLKAVYLYHIISQSDSSRRYVSGHYFMGIETWIEVPCPGEDTILSFPLILDTLLSMFPSP